MSDTPRVPSSPSRLWEQVEKEIDRRIARLWADEKVMGDLSGLIHAEVNWLRSIRAARAEDAARLTALEQQLALAEFNALSYKNLYEKERTMHPTDTVPRPQPIDASMYRTRVQEVEGRLAELVDECGALRANRQATGREERAFLDALIAAGFPILIPSDSLPPLWQVAQIIVQRLQQVEQERDEQAWQLGILRAELSQANDGRATSEAERARQHQAACDATGMEQFQCKRAEAAEATLRVLEAQQAWQPMATAPKDGRRIWLLTEYPKVEAACGLGAEMYIGSWQRNGFEPSGYWEDEETGEKAVPTCWRPLAPPADPGQEQL